MANYYATTRSNYFRVKDRQLFAEEMEACNIRVLEHTTEPDLICITSDLDGGWPCDREVTPAGDSPYGVEDYELSEILPKHLQEGEVAVLMEVGHEKLRYLVGAAQAVAWDGRIESVDLEKEIMEVACLMTGKEVTHPNY